MEANKHTTKQWMSEPRNKRGNLKTWMETKWKQNDPKFSGHNKSSSKRYIYRDITLPLETRKNSNTQTNLTPKGAREEHRVKL